MAVNIQKSYSALNASLTRLFDESGVKRSFSVPYVDGQEMADHVSAVGQVAGNVGGLTNNLLTTSHHEGGKGWGSGDGHTVGHPAEDLRNTIIPKDDEHAKDAIAAAEKNLNNIESLLGEDDPTIKVAKGQLAMVKKTEGAGMNLLDFGIMLVQTQFAPMQSLARAHSGTKEGGHAPQLRAPGGSSAPPSGDQGAPAGGAPEAQAAPAAPEASGAAPEAPAAPAGAPAASQA